MSLSPVQKWQEVSEGNPSAYFGTCISGFPNFFVMMGPNAVTGHLSVIYTTECQINFTLRIIGPVLRALRASRSSLSPIGFTADVVQVTPEAEKRDVDWVQEKAEKLVWATGCTSWAVDPTTNRNTALYPDWPFKYWLRSVFIPWKDFRYSLSKSAIEAGVGSWLHPSLFAVVTLSAVAGVLGYASSFSPLRIFQKVCSVKNLL